VDAANDGDVIKVTAGTYTGVQGRTASPGYEGPSVITQVVYISKTVTIRGGYTTSNWMVSEPDANPTTLDAQSRGRVFYVTGDISPTIEGLRVTGGDSAKLGGDPIVGEAGGGVYVINATVTISGCRVTGNTANSFAPFGGVGGGIYLLSGNNTTLSGNAIQGNDAQAGGGIYLAASDSVSLVGNTIQGNAASGWYGASGGGVYVRDSSNTTLVGNSIQHNSAQDGGGVLLTGSNNATLISNTIFSNTAIGSHTFFDCAGVSLWVSDEPTLSGNLFQDNYGEEGGGIFLWNSNNATLSGNIIQRNRGWAGGVVNLYASDGVRLDNNVLIDNHVEGTGTGIRVAGSTAQLRHTTLVRNGNGSGLYVTEGSTLALTNTVLVRHTVGITVTAGSTASLHGVLWHGNDANISGPGAFTVTHEITGNPAFAADGYHITSASAALDAGVDAGVTVDIDGDPRPVGAGYDVGADELFNALRVTKQANPDPVEPGGQLTYTIRITNTGFVGLHATITDTLPLSVTLGKTSGSTLLPPDGSVKIVWTAIITALGGVWTEQVVVTVDEGYTGLLTNLVEVTTEEGAMGDDSVTVVAGRRIYLPLVMRDFS
jgi:uncharacterized repeat protein (TIGR01451 family)